MLYLLHLTHVHEQKKTLRFIKYLFWHWCRMKLLEFPRNLSQFWLTAVDFDVTLRMWSCIPWGEVDVSAECLTFWGILTVCCLKALKVLFVFSSVWLVLGSDELGGCRDEAEGETGRILPGPRQFGPSIHPEPQLQVAGSHTPHTHGALPRWDTNTHWLFSPK